MHRAASIAAFVALLALHLDGWWRAPFAADEAWFGVPAELAYRLAWIAAAWLWLLHFCARVWRTAPEEEAA